MRVVLSAVFCSLFSITCFAGDLPKPTGPLVDADAKLELLFTRTAPIAGGLTEGPAVAPDGSIYFSSNRAGGNGGLDIYKAVRLKDRWVKPENLKAPMNSGGDDFGIVIDPDAKPEGDSIIQMGYITSNRLGGKGARLELSRLRTSVQMPT